MGELREKEISNDTYIKDRPLQGEIWTVDLRDNRGHEMNKIRPCLIIQGDEFNRKLQTTVVIPITKMEAQFETEFDLTDDVIEFTRFPEGVKGSVCGIQVTTVDLSKMGRFIGKLNEKGVGKVREILGKILMA